MKGKKIKNKTIVWLKNLIQITSVMGYLKERYLAVTSIIEKLNQAKMKNKTAFLFKFLSI